MIGLLEIGTGAIPLADIKSLQLVYGGVGQAEHHVLTRHSGSSSLKVLAHEYTELMGRPIQLLPADIGTRLIMTFSSPGDDHVYADSDPVIAWALCVDGQVRPVLPSGVRRVYRFSDQNVWHPDYVQLPDGSIYQYGLESEPGTYADIDAVIAEETARLQKHEAQRDAAEATAQGVTA